MASLNSFSGGITLKSSQKLLSYTNGVSAKMVCTDNRSLWSKRLTLSVSILQVTISNHVCRLVLLSHLFFCFILKCKSAYMVDVICLFPRFIGYGINHLLGNNPDVAASFLNQHVGCFMYIPRSQLESCPEQGAVFRVDVEFTAIIGILGRCSKETTWASRLSITARSLEV